MPFQRRMQEVFSRFLRSLRQCRSWNIDKREYRRRLNRTSEAQGRRSGFVHRKQREESKSLLISPTTMSLIHFLTTHTHDPRQPAILSDYLRTIRQSFRTNSDEMYFPVYSSTRSLLIPEP